MQYSISFFTLAITVLIELILFGFIKKRTGKRNQLITAFSLSILCLTLWCLGLMFQILVINFVSLDLAIYVDYFVYITIAFSPVAIFFVAYIYLKKQIEFKKWYLLLFIIPVTTMFILWTNDFHHLFYESYSINISETLFGPYFYIHSLYTYILFAVDITILLKTSIKQSSILSKQSLLIIIGSLFPLVINILGMIGLHMNVYITPISFIITLFFYGTAILRYNFLNIAPIALKRLVDQMSDLYLVLNHDCVISDCNKPFEKVFKIKRSDLIGKDIFSLNFTKKIISKSSSFKSYITNAQKSEKFYHLQATLKDTEKHFNIEISGIYEDNQCIGVLILFKDITQHILDMKTLEQNQNTLLEKERLASLGQMVGGIAHNLKTPIMSIAGAADGLEDLIKEYNSSIDDPEVTKQDHHDIATEMGNWVSKIRTYDSYMSDVITAVKGQAVNMNDDKPILFTIEELLNRVNILMKHELKNALVSLNIKYDGLDSSTSILGNINSLVQVINNIISNAIQAYNGKPNQTIDLVISTSNNNILISIVDYGSGIPKEVQDKLFSQMITTKGQNGTGLGLFMSYSTIKGHFKGDITFESEVGKGTTFSIILPHN